MTYHFVYTKKNPPYSTIQAMDPGWRDEVAKWWGINLNHPSGRIARRFLHDHYSYSE